jgi:hypothetical protein
MLHLHASSSSATSEDRENRIRAVMDQLRPAAEQFLRQAAEDLVDAPDQQLLGDVELRLRDHAHDLAATAHQTGLQGRKTGGTAAPVSPAPTA